MPKTVKKLTREEYQEPDEVIQDKEVLEIETDPIEELRLCKSSIIYIFRIDSITRQRRRVGQCAPEGLTWEMVERYGPGDYYLVAHRGGRYIASKTVFIDAGITPSTDRSADLRSASHAPLAQDRDAFMTEMAGIVRDVMTQAMQGAQKAPPDDYFKSMANAFQNGMEMTKAMIPKPQEPDRMFDILDRVLDIKDRLGDDSGDWQSRIFRMVEPFVGSIIEKGAILGRQKAHLPSRTGADQRRDAPPNRSVNPPPLSREPASALQPETSQANGLEKSRESRVERPETAGNGEAPPTLQEFVFAYTKFLSLRVRETDPELRAEVFVEDVPGSLDEDLQKALSQENSFEILRKLCPHIESDLDWFRQWHDVVKEIVLQTEDEDDEPDITAPEGTA